MFRNKSPFYMNRFFYHPQSNIPKHAIGRTTYSRSLFSSIDTKPAPWGVAWDIDGTLTRSNSYSHFKIYSVHRFISLEKTRRIANENNWLQENLDFSQEKTIRLIAAAGGNNCIVTANPFIHFPRVVLEGLGLTPEEISKIPVFRSFHFWQGKNVALKRAMLRFGISRSDRLAIIEDNDYIIEKARYCLSGGHPGFYNFMTEDIARFIRRVSECHNQEKEEANRCLAGKK